MRQAPAPRVEVHPSPNSLATSAAGAFLSRLLQIQAAGREAHVALTGGTIAGRVHEEVARLAPASGIDWSRVVIWWSDERFVEPGSPDRNDSQATTGFLLSVKASHMHPMPSTDEAEDVEGAAAAYSDLLRKTGPERFDIVLLGMGPDGHVASLFPGSSALGVVDQQAVGVDDSPKPPPERISLTLPALNRSAAVWLLVSGEEKAEAVEAALALDGTVNQTPARGVFGRSETVWFLDKGAAALL